MNENNVKSAGFWIRSVAVSIDAVVVGILNLILSFAIFGKTFFNEVSFNSDFIACFAEVVRNFIINILVSISYETVLIGYNGQTIGKLLTKIKVVNIDGSQLSYSKSFGRVISKFLNILTFGIGYLFVAFRKDKRGLHDLIVDTKVIIKNLELRMEN